MNDHATAGGSPVELADRLLRPVENAAAILAGAMMFLAMVLTTADALLRYTLSKPLSFNFFFTENYLLVGLVCLPMAWGYRTGGYIRLSFLTHLVPPAIGTLLFRVGHLVGAVLAAALAWLGGRTWYETLVTGKVEIDVVNWPWHWSWIWVPIGVGLLALRVLLVALGPASELNAAHAPEEEGV